MMADVLKGLFGVQKPEEVLTAGDDAFADYAEAPDPTPIELTSFATGTSQASSTPSVSSPLYTAWYRVWERSTWEDFKVEMYILPMLFIVITVHIWGKRRNRKIIRTWTHAHSPVLMQEFSQVGYIRPTISAEDPTATIESVVPNDFLREKKANEYTAYATGRHNIAFLDLKLTLAKRFNPLMRFGEQIVALFLESFSAPQERLEATAYAFDGQESKVVPSYSSADTKKVSNSTFDGFVFAIIHKDVMKRLRDDRYDLSLTATRDHAKLPVWTTVMSESPEITDTLLTPELIGAIKEAGDAFEALIVSDQPTQQPMTLEDTKPRKRVSLSLKINIDYTSTLPVFAYFIRLPDRLVSSAHFRPEALRRIKQTREERIAKLRKADDEEKAEERKLAADKLKREQRDAKLSRLSADEQRKFLEKERERNAKKGMKRSTIKA